MSLDDKENKQLTISRDTITETLKENADLLLDQNLIYDILNHGEKRNHPQVEVVENKVAEYLEQTVDIEPSIHCTEKISAKNVRFCDVGVEEPEMNSFSLNNQGIKISPFAQVLILELKTERQKSMDISTDLSMAKSSLSETQRELEILRQRDGLKLKQIEDSNRNLKNITLSCKNSANLLAKDLEISRNQNKDLYRKNVNLENEKKDLKSIVQSLNENIHASEDIQRDLAMKNEKLGVALKENRKLNDDILVIREKLLSFETESAKQEEEKEFLKYSITALEENLKDVSSSSSCLEVEVLNLKERHSAVMQKALHDEKQMMEAIQEITHLKKEKNLLRTELHDFYKKKLHTALTQSKKDMQARFETELKEKAAADLAKMSDMRNLYEKNMNSVVDQYSLQVATLSKKVSFFQEKNSELSQQREAIVRALSAQGSGEMTGNFPQATQNVMCNNEIDLHTEYLSTPKLKESQLPSLDLIAPFKVPQRVSSSSNKESLKRNNLEGITLPRLITSTSISSIHDSSSENSRKIDLQAQLRQRRKTARLGTPGRKPSRHMYSALDIVDSFDTGISSSNSEFPLSHNSLSIIDREVIELQKELNVISVDASSVDFSLYKPDFV